MATVRSTQGIIVARFLDGRQVKGVAHDFAANKPELHVFDRGDESTKAILVLIQDLKAIFFVKSYSGDKSHQEYKLFDRAKVQARKILVRFLDGENLVGFTVGYNRNKQGFFVTPADPESNNTRVFVVNRAVRDVHWI